MWSWYIMILGIINVIWVHAVRATNGSYMLILSPLAGRRWFCSYVFFASEGDHPKTHLFCKFLRYPNTYTMLLALKRFWDQVVDGFIDWSGWCSGPTLILKVPQKVIKQLSTTFNYLMLVNCYRNILLHVPSIPFHGNDVNDLATCLFLRRSRASGQWTTIRIRVWRNWLVEFPFDFP